MFTYLCCLLIVAVWCVAVRWWVVWCGDCFGLWLYWCGLLLCCVFVLLVFVVWLVDLWLLLCFGGLLADLGCVVVFDGLLFDGWCWFVGYWFVDIVWLLLFVIVVVDITVVILRLVGLGGRVLITLLLLVCWLRCCLFGFC